MSKYLLLKKMSMWYIILRGSLILNATCKIELVTCKFTLKKQNSLALCSNWTRGSSVNYSDDKKSLFFSKCKSTLK